MSAALAMERGGGALGATLRASPLSSWPLFPRRIPRLRRSFDRPPCSPRRAAPDAAAPLRFLPRLRSCNCSYDGDYLILEKGFEKRSFKAFSSYGPQEPNLSTEEIKKDKLLIDCREDQECVLGGIVALGKFDALHVGHRQLAIQASKAGTPFLLSFVGIAEVLGWEPRPPIVAKCDRKQVLSSWAPYCGGLVPLEYQVEFTKVRYLTPRQFVERLSNELRISGVVAGENYRFGYKAAGDASELVRLCEEYGLSAYIVSSVMDKVDRSYNGTNGRINSNDRGQVSSSRVRHALAMGDMEYVAELLGRKHRLVMTLDGRCLFTKGKIVVSKSCMLNQPPVDGVYESCNLLVDNILLGPCTVIINTDSIGIKLTDESSSLLNLVQNYRLLSAEFG